MQYSQIPYTEWAKSLSLTNGINHQALPTMSSHIDNSSFNYQYNNILPLATDRKSPDVYQSKPQVLM